MCDKDLLVSFLYDDLGDAERAAFTAHLRQCAACREDLNALRGVRADLISWTPPQPDFGFRVVREPKVVPMAPRSWRAWYSPAAGLAAAAVLVLAAASALAHVEIHSGPDGVTVRTGWATSSTDSKETRSAGATAPAEPRDLALTPASAGTQANAIDPALVNAIVQRLDALEASARAQGNLRNASMLSARASDADLIKRMRELLAQSETKQQGELALRVAQVLRDVEAQRVADLSRIQQGMRGIERTVTEEQQGHREWANYFLSSSKQR